MSNAVLLDEVFDNRLEGVRRWHDDGHVTVGVIGPGVPSELILASGAVPVSLMGDERSEVPNARNVLDENFPHTMRTLMDSAMNGDWAFLDLVVVASNFDMLYHYMDEVVRIGDGVNVPPTHLYELLQHSKPADREYNLYRFHELRRRLESLTGRKVTDEGLRSAVEVVDRRRVAEQRVIDARLDGLCSGAAGFRALAVSQMVKPEDYPRAVETWMSTLEAPEGGASRAVLVSADSLDSDRLHRLFEGHDIQVVAEDGPIGSGFSRREMRLSEDVVESILDHYEETSTSRNAYPITRRFGWLLEKLSDDRIDTLIFDVARTDDTLGWDLPYLVSAARRLGVTNILLVNEDFGASGAAGDIQPVSDLVPETEEVGA